MVEPALFDTKPFVGAPAKPVMFPPGIFKGRERPTGHAEEVRRWVVELVLPEVLAWQFSGGDEDVEVEDVQRDLLDVVEEHGDGYSMAERLDHRHGWDCDSGLVDILDGLRFYEVTKEAVRCWIRDNGVVPKLALGQAVQFVEKWGEHAGTHSGEITKVDLDSGAYHVFCAALGHVREGLGAHARLVDWSDLEAMQEAVHG